MKITIRKEHSSLLLRTYLSWELGISQRLLSSLKKKEKGIMLNGERVTVRAVLREGDILELDTDDSRSSDIPKTEMPLDIIFEDGRFIIINKPPFLPTHPSVGHYTDTLANGVMFHLTESGREAVFRPITRLDRNTSGITLIAKTARDAAILTDMMQSGRIEKKYLAIAIGETEEEFSVEANIKREKESIIKRVTCPENEGRYALTLFRRLSVTDSPEGKLSLLEVTPKTGRTHQIRLHLSHIGHPILGDDLYGSPSNLIRRHALHALGLTLAFGEETLSFEAKVPNDMLLPRQTDIRSAPFTPLSETGEGKVSNSKENPR